MLNEKINKWYRKSVVQPNPCFSLSFSEPIEFKIFRTGLNPIDSIKESLLQLRGSDTSDLLAEIWQTSFLLLKSIVPNWSDDTYGIDELSFFHENHANLLKEKQQRLRFRNMFSLRKLNDFYTVENLSKTPRDTKLSKMPAYIFWSICRKTDRIRSNLNTAFVNNWMLFKWNRLFP